jgi:uncharacterized delta-60 repeat protein
VAFRPLEPENEIGRFRAVNPTVLVEPPQIPAVWGVAMLASWRLACLLVVSVLLTACGGGGAASGASQVPAGMIGAAGGTVTGPGNAQVVIPAGALTQNTAIAIAQSGTGAPPLPAGVVVYGPIFAFTPHGTNFQSAVTITVPFDPAAVPAGTTPVLYKTNAAMNGWDVVAGATISGSTMSASITSFSYLAAGSPTRPVELSNVTRHWWIQEYLADGSSKRFLDDTKDGFEVLDETVSLGDLIYAPPDLLDEEQRTAYERVYSNETGRTYKVSAVAPHASAANQQAVGAYAALDQYQWWKKKESNATLELVVSAIVLEAKSANVVDPRACDVAATVAPAWCLRSSTARATLVVAAVNADRAILLRFGIADVGLSGWQGNWQVEVDAAEFFMTSGLRAGTLLHEQDVDVNLDVDDDDTDGGQDDDGDGDGDNGQHAIVRLKKPLHINIPLDRVGVNERFYVRSRAFAFADNNMQGESYYSAFLRDPVETGGGGVEIVSTGLEPVPPPPETPAEPSIEPLPQCTTGADPAAGTLQFEAGAFNALEVNSAPIVITRTDGAVGAVSVELNTADGSATADTDYTSVTQTLVFEDGEEGRKIVMVPILADSAGEDNETIELSLGNVRGCAELGNQTSATMTIVDDDTAPATFSIGGTVSGLVGSGLVLSTSGSSVNAGNGPFTMPTQLRDGSTYELRVTQQPGNPLQVCSVTRGSGTIQGANVTDIAVDCVTPLPNGALDPSFGGSGKVTNNTLRPAVAMARQSDGKLVILSDKSRLSRYNADGTLDVGFGTNGVAIATFNNASDIAHGLALQSDGKIVVVGRAFGGTLEDFGVARFDTDGTLDTDFGTSGKLLIDINGSFDEAIVPLIQPDGKIVIAGTGGTSGPLGVDTDFAAVRLMSDGDLDTGFGTGGKVRTDIAGRADLVTAALLQPDGKIIVAGRVGVDGGALPDTGLVRYTTTGALDTGDFGGNTGVRRLDLSASGHDHDSPSGVALTADSKIVLAVEAAQQGIFQHTLARLDTHGFIDTSFGTQGVARNSFASGGDFARALAIQTDGRIVTAGSTRPTDSFSDDMLITRHDANGSLDATFGSNGKVLVDFFSSADGAATVLIQPDGKIVAAGIARNANTNSLAIMRVLP